MPGAMAVLAIPGHDIVLVAGCRFGVREPPRSPNRHVTGRKSPPTVSVGK